MEYIKNLLNEAFFDVEFTGWADALKEFLVYIIVIGLVFYLILFLVVKLNKSEIHKDYLIHMNYLVSLSIFLFVVTLYIFFLIKYVGVSQFEWTRGNFYLGIGPQLILYAGTIILFISSYSKFKNRVKNSPNG
ncbi:MAG: hypothetical protein AAF502_01085 [Bacteroidota bacterium]